MGSSGHVAAWLARAEISPHGPPRKWKAFKPSTIWPDLVSNAAATVWLLSSLHCFAQAVAVSTSWRSPAVIMSQRYQSECKPHRSRRMRSHGLAPWMSGMRRHPTKFRTGPTAVSSVPTASAWGTTEPPTPGARRRFHLRVDMRGVPC